MLLNASAASRTYNMRTCPRSGTITQSRSSISESPDASSLSSEAPPCYEGAASNTEATGTVRLYSDAVALRPPSPHRERPLLSSLSPVEVPDHARKPELLKDGHHKGHGIDPRKVEDDELGEVVETPDKPEYTGWTKVQHKRARSDSFVNKTLTSGQQRLVDLARENLTKEQQQKLQKRQEKICPRRASSMSS